MRNDTLNALILRHGDRMLKDTGWPPCVDMMQIAPETMPGWSVATGSLDAAQILALVTHLCQPLTYGRAGLLTASARRLAGTPARLYLYPAKGFMPPEKLADVQTLHLPYAQEWLTAAECDGLLAFLKASLTHIAEIVRLDAHRLAAALKPSVTPRLMDRRFGDWRVLADEYEHENWLDENDTDVLDAVLTLFWCAEQGSAPSCSPWSMNDGRKSKPQVLSPICCVSPATRPAAGSTAAYCMRW